MSRKAIVGTNRIGGMLGWTRESLSSRSESDIRGEARSFSARLPAAPSSASLIAITGQRIPIRRPGKESVRRESGLALDGFVAGWVEVDGRGQDDLAPRDGDEVLVLRESVR